MATSMLRSGPFSIRAGVVLRLPTQAKWLESNRRPESRRTQFPFFPARVLDFHTFQEAYRSGRAVQHTASPDGSRGA